MNTRTVKMLMICCLLMTTVSVNAADFSKVKISVDDLIVNHCTSTGHLNQDTCLDITNDCFDMGFSSRDIQFELTDSEKALGILNECFLLDPHHK